MVDKFLLVFKIVSITWVAMGIMLIGVGIREHDYQAEKKREAEKKNETPYFQIIPMEPEGDIIWPPDLKLQTQDEIDA